MHKLDSDKIKKFQKAATQIRQDILNISYTAGVGHIAPALSIADILTVLYEDVLGITPATVKNPTRNRFILSKGHAAAALYACLYRKKLISRTKLYGYCRDKGELGVHPDYNPESGIEMTTGSLGHGLAVAAGMAYGLAKKYPRRPPEIYILISDAELNEGSVWEALMFAGQHKISNLTLIIDANGNQAFGKTRDVIDLEPLPAKIAGFGWITREINGHNISQISRSLKKNPHKKPLCIVARTHAGAGVSFMTDQVRWHYLPLNEQQYKQAIRETGKNIK